MTNNAITVLERRYLKKDENGKVIETPGDMFMRVAETIADIDKKYDETADVSALAESFYGMMKRLDFLPNSPTLMNAGRPLGQLSACFVLPVGDSIEEIFDAVKHTAMIHKSGGGTGFSFSRLRPANDVVSTTSGISSGPLSFMKVFDIATETIKQGGTRRGANMAIMRVDHPNIMDFIVCKADQKQLNNFNISIGLTEMFMQAVERDEEYNLVNPRDKKVCGTLKAREVFRLIVKQAWENGEPGIVFLDRLNRHNPTPLIGEIEATNPCGEQPLLPYESCNLGSINLGNFINGKTIEWERLKTTIHKAVHFLDNVIDANKYPLQQIHDMTHANRKIGLGIMGWADMLIKLGLAYNSATAVRVAGNLMSFINNEAHIASQELGKLRGSFPNFKGSIFDTNDHPPQRNATTTTIAPTGTISIIANSSSGIEPLFAVSYIRTIMDKDELLEVNPLFEQIAIERGFYSEELMRKIALTGSVQGIEEVPRDVQKTFVTAHEISPECHIQMQAAFQKFTDNAISKTVNFSNSATVEDVEKVYRLAYETGCKGVTIYRDGSRNEQVLSTGKKEVAVVKPDAKRERPKALKGMTHQMQTGCGHLYVTINEDKSGLFEVLTTMGKAGGCAASQSEALGRMVSLALRSGVLPRQVVKQLQGISCHCPSGFGDNKILSCADAVAKSIQQHFDDDTTKVTHERGACPECGGIIEHEGGCSVCRSCGFSECG